MKAHTWVMLAVLAVSGSAYAQGSLPILPKPDQAVTENRRVWERYGQESDRFFQRLQDEWRWQQAEEAKQQRHKEMLEEMRRQHMDDMVQQENEYRARFGARDRNCFLGRGPVWDC